MLADRVSVILIISHPSDGLSSRQKTAGNNALEPRLKFLFKCSHPVMTKSLSVVVGTTGPVENAADVSMLGITGPALGG